MLDTVIIVLIVGWFFIWQSNAKEKRARKGQKPPMKDGMTLDPGTGFYRGQWKEDPDGNVSLKMESPHPLHADYDKIRQFLHGTFELRILDHYWKMCKELGASSRVMNGVEEELLKRAQTYGLSDADIDDLYPGLRERQENQAFKKRPR